MIYGIGTDLIEIDRIAAACERHGERFAERILGPQELERFHERGRRASRRGLSFLATRFAAKEAVSKAIGLGMRMPMTWRAVQILNAPSGRPEAVASGDLASFLRARKLKIHVSVTDERALAAAYAIAEIVEDVEEEKG